MTSHAPDRVEAGLNQTLSDLGLDYLDLYLMHWPVGKGPSDKSYQYDYVQTWQAMEQLLRTGRVSNIGISNFSPNQVRELIEKSNIKPAVHQMELHPYLPQGSWIRAQQIHEISITSYSPLGNQNPTYGDRTRRSPTTQLRAPLLLKDQIINDIAEKRGCTPAQVVLAWGMNRGTSVIPKSQHKEYIKENIGALKCVLQGDDFARIGKLGEEPRRFNNPSRAWGVKLFEGLDDAWPVDCPRRYGQIQMHAVTNRPQFPRPYRPKVSQPRPWCDAMQRPGSSSMQSMVVQTSTMLDRMAQHSILHKQS